VARGGADAAIAGGAESKLNPMGLLRQGLLKRLAACDGTPPERLCRPLDAGARGTVIGEGGGLLIVEDLQRAHARGARVYAELAGFGAACDPQGVDVTRPTAGGLELAVRKALDDAGIGAEQVGLIAAHGTAVPSEDQREIDAWRAALGPAAEKIPAFAMTGAIGSLFAGAGGAGLAACAMALHTQTVPPTANFASRDGGLNLAARPRPAKMQYAVSGAFSVGGQSGAIVLRRVEG